MNSQIIRDADIGPALLKLVIQASSRSWPHMEITTPHGTLHLLEVQEVTERRVVDGKLTFVAMLVKQPIGREVTIIWPPEGVEAPAFGITGLEVYEH